MTSDDSTNPIDGFTAEDWRAVPGYAGLYQVSTLGAVQSLRTLRFLRQIQERGGYLRVTLYGPDGSKPWPVHHLVLRAFLGPCPRGREAAHLNGHKRDNRLSNLLWLTKAENEHHKVQHGTLLVGERHPSARLTLDAVLEIRERCRRGESRKALASAFGVSANYVSKIANGHVWTRALSAHWRRGQAA